MMTQRKYVSLSKLSFFLDNLKNIFVSKEKMNALETIIDAKADIEHSHDDKYYTEDEIDNKVYTISTSITTSLNEATSYSDARLLDAKNYTDTAVTQKTQVQIITWEADD